MADKYLERLIENAEARAKNHATKLHNQRGDILKEIAGAIGERFGDIDKRIDDEEMVRETQIKSIEPAPVIHTKSKNVNLAPIYAKVNELTTIQHKHHFVGIASAEYSRYGLVEHYAAALDLYDGLFEVQKAFFEATTKDVFNVKSRVELSSSEEVLKQLPESIQIIRKGPQEEKLDDAVRVK